MIQEKGTPFKLGRSFPVSLFLPNFPIVPFFSLNSSSRVLTYNCQKVFDDVSVGVSRDAVSALLGPNGTWKTTTFNLIREHITPSIPFQHVLSKILGRDVV